MANEVLVYVLKETTKQNKKLQKNTKKKPTRPQKIKKKTKKKPNILIDMLNCSVSPLSLILSPLRLSFNKDYEHFFYISYIMSQFEVLSKCF